MLCIVVRCCALLYDVVHCCMMLCIVVRCCSLLYLWCYTHNSFLRDFGLALHHETAGSWPGWLTTPTVGMCPSKHSWYACMACTSPRSCNPHSSQTWTYHMDTSHCTDASHECITCIEYSLVLHTSQEEFRVPLQCSEEVSPMPVDNVSIKSVWQCGNCTFINSALRWHISDMGTPAQGQCNTLNCEKGKKMN